MAESKDDPQYLFNHAQDLGNPTVFPPSVQGKIPVSVQFVIPNLKLGTSDRKNIDMLARKCIVDLWAVDTQNVENRRTKVPATLFTLAFYIPPTASEEQNRETIVLASRLLIERFLGLFSFLVGGKLSSAHTQATTISKEGHYHKYFTTTERSSIPPDRGKFLTNLKNITLSESVWAALVWLRRGLAERDPVETFSSLMVSLQIMARHLVEKEPITQRCPSCGVKLDTQEPSITSLIRELVVSKLGADPKLFERLWTARNAIVAHGNRPLTPEVFIELTELKFDAAILVFQSIKLGLGIPKDAPPSPNQAFFITDAFMYVD